MRRAVVISTILSAVVVVLAACEAEEKNARIMEYAARTLSFPEPTNAPGNRAYTLEKTKGGGLAQDIRSKVAVIFGYSDNSFACNVVADALIKHSASGGGPPDGYYCNAID